MWATWCQVLTITCLCTNASNRLDLCSAGHCWWSARGDPQFFGLIGQSFQVHGLDNTVYTIISHRDVGVNASFGFLTGPLPCPTVERSLNDNNKPESISCWSHAGSYLSELGLFTRHSARS
jgi:hypothetical protein